VPTSPQTAQARIPALSRMQLRGSNDWRRRPRTGEGPMQSNDPNRLRKR
jgi:hypothetical protein